MGGACGVGEEFMLCGEELMVCVGGAYVVWEELVVCG